MKKIIAVFIFIYFALPTIASAMYNPYCNCDFNPQVIGGTEEENQRLKDYFDNPGSISIEDVDNSSDFEQDWYRTAKEEISMNRTNAINEYDKGIATYPEEYHSLLKQSFDAYIESLDATEFAVDKIHTEISSNLYSFNNQAVSRKIAEYINSYLESKGEATPPQEKVEDSALQAINVKIDDEVQNFSESPVIVDGSL